nr:hypothetical protein [Aureimonas mangrovi]
MRDFLFSEIAAIHGLQNVPDDPELAIAAGRQLCENILEPLQDAFGRIAVRSSFRSSEVNIFGNEQQKAGKAGYNCARNESNYAGHIWDRRDEHGNMGATACVVVPSFWDRFQGEGDWRKMAWWVHDHLPYAEMEFFPRYWAFNVTWRENQRREKIYSFCKPKGVLTRAGMANHEGSHEAEWRGIVDLYCGSRQKAGR